MPESIWAQNALIRHPVYVLASRPHVSNISSELQTKANHLESVARYVPATRQRFRGVNCTLLIGVRFVGNVDNRSFLDSIDISICLANMCKDVLTSRCPHRSI